MPTSRRMRGRGRSDPSVLLPPNRGGQARRVSFALASRDTFEPITRRSCDMRLPSLLCQARMRLRMRGGKAASRRGPNCGRHTGGYSSPNYLRPKPVREYVSCSKPGTSGLLPTLPCVAREKCPSDSAFAIMEGSSITSLPDSGVEMVVHRGIRGQGQAKQGPGCDGLLRERGKSTPT